MRPLLAEILPGEFADWQCNVVALEMERSFWEKATILHAEYYRPPEKPMPDRFSRHYADTVALTRQPGIESAIRDRSLCNRVVDWKSRFFGNGWARYDLAQPGTFRLVPPEGRIQALRRDYDAMRPMYLTEPTTFDDVLVILEELERRINSE